MRVPGSPTNTEDGSTRLESRAETMHKKLVVFFSAPEDSEVLKSGHFQALARNLRQKGYQYEVITSLTENVRMGMDWRQEIDDTLRKTSHLVIILSANFLASDFCMDEILPKAQAMGIEVIPINWRACDSKELIDPNTLIPQGAAISSRERKGAEDDALTEFSEILRKRLAPDDEKDIRESTRGGATNVMGTLETVSDAIHNIPMARNLHYVGPDALFESIEEGLKDGRVINLQGLPGMGKTKAALEFAYRSLKKYKYVLWLKGANQEEILASLEPLAPHLGLPSPLTLSDFQQWLREKKDYLAIVDDTDEETLETILPPQRGDVVVTSQKLIPRALHISLERLDDDQGALLLLRESNILGPHQKLSEADPKLVEEAKKLVQFVGGYPHAIQLASCFLASGTPISEYMALCETEGRELVHEEVSDSRYRYSLKDAIGLSLEKLKKENANALELLKLCAFFEGDEIFVKDLKKIPSFGGALHIERSLGVLHKFSLLRRDKDTITLNGIVRHVLIHTIDREEQEKLRAVIAESQAHL